MNAAEHYRQAETLLDGCRNAERGTPYEASLLAEAQIHATLALADCAAALVELKLGEIHDGRTP